MIMKVMLNSKTDVELMLSGVTGFMIVDDLCVLSFHIGKPCAETFVSGVGAVCVCIVWQ